MQAMTVPKPVAIKLESRIGLTTKTITTVINNKDFSHVCTVIYSTVFFLVNASDIMIHDLPGLLAAPYTDLLL